jgi:4-hydroxy-tetrahydrodipicolinate reductase
MNTIIFGDGRVGTAIATALRDRGTDPTVVGRPPAGGHDPGRLGAPELAFEASRSEAVLSNVRAALAAGCLQFVVATTAWESERSEVDATLRSHGASAVVAANLSIGAAVVFRLVDHATELLGRFPDFEPFIVEWHRRSKADRPSGTARELGRRITARHPATADRLDIAVVRAGSSPGMHLIGFDAPGETIELRLTARDRSAYAAGALAAADWLTASPRAPGIHSFDAVLDDLLAPPALASIA